MEYAEYKIMFEAEDGHWWYKGLRCVLFALLRLERANPRSLKILDAGCGTGGNLAALQQSGFNYEGFDFSPVAVEFCWARGLDKVRLGSILEVAFPERTFDIVVSCDVLNDAGTADEEKALSELLRVLKPGGRLFLNLPAFSFLRGEHDQATDVARRYTRGEIRRKLVRAGFVPVRITYWNMFLFPMVLLVRILKHGRGVKGEPRSDIAVLPAPLNWLLTLVMRLEAGVISKLNLPVGSSIAIVARRPP